MELWSLFVTAFIVGFSGALMPGPVLAVTIAESPTRGVSTGPIITGGHAIAELAVVILLSVGLATFADNKTIAGFIGVAGGAMLIFMGAGMLYDLLKARIKAVSAEGKAKGSARLVLDGVITSLSNPYWYVWWATTGSVFLIKSLEHGVIGPPVFYVGHILSDLAWYSFVSFLIWRGRKLIVGLGYKLLIAACALFLIYLGGFFIHDGLTGAV